MTSSFHQRKKKCILFISVDLCVMKRQRNQPVMNLHSGRATLGSDLRPVPLWGSARGAAFVSASGGAGGAGGAVQVAGVVPCS